MPVNKAIKALNKAVKQGTVQQLQAIWNAGDAGALQSALAAVLSSPAAPVKTSAIDVDDAKALLEAIRAIKEAPQTGGVVPLY